MKNKLLAIVFIAGSMIGSIQANSSADWKNYQNYLAKGNGATSESSAKSYWKKALSYLNKCTCSGGNRKVLRVCKENIARYKKSLNDKIKGSWKSPRNEYENSFPF